MSGQLKGEKIFHGIAVSAGVCRGKILVLHRARHIISRREISDANLESEIKRFEHSLVRTRTQIKEVQRRVTENMSSSEGDIFEAHLLMLEDRVVIDEVFRLIREQKVNADFAYHTVSGRYIAAMEQVEDEYLRERAADMKDLTGRVLDNLLEVKDAFDLKHLSEPCILVAHDLSPSTTAQLNKKLVLGFATDIGGKTSHTAIMARSLDIPAIVGLKNFSEEVDSGDYVFQHGQELGRTKVGGKRGRGQCCDGVERAPQRQRHHERRSVVGRAQLGLLNQRLRETELREERAEAKRDASHGQQAKVGRFEQARQYRQEHELPDRVDERGASRPTKACNHLRGVHAFRPRLTRGGRRS